MTSNRGFEGPCVVRVQGARCRVWGLRLRVYGGGVRVAGLGLSVQCLWFVVYGLWFMVYGLWCVVIFLGVRVWGLGFEVDRTLCEVPLPHHPPVADQIGKNTVERTGCGEDPRTAFRKVGADAFCRRQGGGAIF